MALNGLWYVKIVIKVSSVNRKKSSERRQFFTNFEVFAVAAVSQVVVLGDRSSRRQGSVHVV